MPCLAINSHAFEGPQFNSVYELADYQQTLDSDALSTFKSQYVDRKKPEEAPEWLKKRLPQPILEGHPEWVSLYWKAWRLASLNMFKAKAEQTHLPKYYMDEVYNGNSFMWNTAFMIQLAKWAWYMWPSIQSFETFYNSQCKVKDGSHNCNQDYYKGYIPREVFGDGSRCCATACNGQTNSPLFSWVEWEHFGFSADTARIEYVLPIIIAQYEYIEERMKITEGPNAGLYKTNSLGSGMDATPRLGTHWSQIKGAWVCITAQQALNAEHISKMAGLLGKKDIADIYTARYEVIKKEINDKLWDSPRGFYADKMESPNNFSNVESNSSFWPFLAGIPDVDKAKKMVEG